MYYLGIDLGGTNVHAGVVDEKGGLLAQANVSTPRGAESVVEAIHRAALEAAEGAGVPLAELRSAGLASAGSIDPVEGLVLHAYNLGLDHVPLARMVSERLEMPTFLENDANAAALGEFVAGAGRGYHSLVAVTLGTGVGAGAVMGGKLFTGFNYAGMEAGHMVIHRGGRACTCGRKGCWEAYASATGLIRSTREAMEAHPESALWRFAAGPEQVNGRTVFDACEAGDPAAQAVLRTYLEDLACGVTNLINILQPEVLCIGGGISRQGEKLLKPLREVLDREEFTRDSPRRTTLRVARLSSEAGIIGAALVPKYR